MSSHFDSHHQPRQSVSHHLAALKHEPHRRLVTPPFTLASLWKLISLTGVQTVFIQPFQHLNKERASALICSGDDDDILTVVITLSFLQDRDRS